MAAVRLLLYGCCMPAVYYDLNDCCSIRNGFHSAIQRADLHSTFPHLLHPSSTNDGDTHAGFAARDASCAYARGGAGAVVGAAHKRGGRGARADKGGLPHAAGGGGVPAAGTRTEKYIVCSGL